MSFCYVPKANNKIDISSIGKSVNKWRVQNTELSIEDIAYMTGLARRTIENFECGNNITLKSFIEISVALGKHPKHFLSEDLVLEPKFKLSAKRQERHLVSSRLRKLINETDFFNQELAVKEVQQHLLERFNIEVNSTIISVVLKRLVQQGILKYRKEGRNNLYSKKRRKNK